MTKSNYILSIDQGTTGTTALLIDQNLNVVAKVGQEFPQIYPRDGWVEHDPEAIWQSVVEVIQKVVGQAKIQANQIASIGITNQRETTLLWDRATGKPVANAIVWQDRRTADHCQQLKEQGLEEMVRKKTGLVLDPYFSGTKLEWLLKNVEGAAGMAKQGRLAFGTIDSFLVWRLTGGAAHVTDATNASRTLLMNLESGEWDEELLDLFNIPRSVLPRIVCCSEEYGKTKGLTCLPDGIPVAGMAGDQQAALIGQACFEVGQAKCTYGTGSFILLNIGEKPKPSNHRLLTTLAYQLNGKRAYAWEGSAFIAGAAVQWLRDGLGLIESADQIEALAEEVGSSDGVVFVPALVGLGAPHWRPEARGIISGINRGTTKAHLARATLEGIAFCQYDILQAMVQDLGKPLSMLKVDGGAAANNLLMQFQSDILQVPISRPAMLETTALGAAFLAGLAVGFWSDLESIRAAWKEERNFQPKMPKEELTHRVQLWQKAVAS